MSEPAKPEIPEHDDEVQEIPTQSPQEVPPRETGQEPSEEIPVHEIDETLTARINGSPGSKKWSMSQMIRSLRHTSSEAL